MTGCSGTPFFAALATISQTSIDLHNYGERKRHSVRRHSIRYTSRPMQKLHSQFLLLPALCLTLLPLSAKAQSLLVVNQGDSNVSIVDAASARQVATVDEKTPGVHGHEIAASEDGRTAFWPIY